MQKISCVLADDNALLRECLVARFQQEPDVQVVADTGDPSEALHLTLKTKPQVLVLDLIMPGRCTLEVITTLRKSAPQVKILPVTMLDDEALMTQVLQLGAHGFVIKSSSYSMLLSSIRSVHKGGRPIDPTMMRHLVHIVDKEYHPAVTSRSCTVTDRERTILKLTAEGNSAKEIACLLGLSAKTVEAHKFNVMQKLDLHNSAQILSWAIGQGLLLKEKVRFCCSKQDSCTSDLSSVAGGAV